MAFSIAVSPSQYDRLVKDCGTQGIQITGDQGQFNSHGCTIAYNYDQARHVLHLSVLSKPWLYPTEAVEARLHDLVQTSIAGGLT